MITREEYNKALDIVEAYHKQLFIGGVSSSLRNVKTEIVDWEKLKDCSVRLRNGLVGEYHRRKLIDNKILYIEDITRKSLRKFPNIGKRSWLEFFQIREY